VLAHVVERVEVSEARAFDLAAEFLSTLLGEHWPRQFERWADERRLGQELRAATRRAILRERTFGALERFQKRQADEGRRRG
jgi:hypothetical protein